MINKHLILQLNLIPGMGPAAIYGYLHRAFPGSVDFLNPESFSTSTESLNKIKEGLESDTLLRIELELAEKHKIKITTIFEDEYPKLLKQIHLPPPLIYWVGENLNFENCIAVVGARKADFLAKEAIDKIVPILVENGWCIVSGGALGADSMAHEKALESSGATIAVLGSGLLELYPARNKNLFNRMQSKGAVISTFPLLMQPLPQNFPIRNRIISGLSKGVIVAQAAKKSGAKITADFALEQGRDVFAVPGPFNHELSEGCNILIQNGAKLTYCPEDILSEYGQKISKIKADLKNDPNFELLNFCAIPRALDDIQESLGLGLRELQGKLFDLQLEGKMKQNFAGFWQTI